MEDLFNEAEAWNDHLSTDEIVMIDPLNFMAAVSSAVHVSNPESGVDIMERLTMRDKSDKVQSNADRLSRILDSKKEEVDSKSIPVVSVAIEDEAKEEETKDENKSLAESKLMISPPRNKTRASFVRQTSLMSSSVILEPSTDPLSLFASTSKQHELEQRKQTNHPFNNSAIQPHVDISDSLFLGNDNSELSLFRPNKEHSLFHLKLPKILKLLYLSL